MVQGLPQPPAATQQPLYALSVTRPVDEMVESRTFPLVCRIASRYIR